MEVPKTQTSLCVNILLISPRCGIAYDFQFFWGLLNRQDCDNGIIIINDKNCSLFIVLTAMDQKLQKS